MLRIIKFLFLVSVIIVGVAVHLRNDILVSFDYYRGIIQLPLSLFMLLSICIGAVIGIISILPLLIKLKREKSRLTSQVKLNEEELATLRFTPVED